MSFSPLQPYKWYDLSPQEMALHKIDSQGNSTRDCYKGSVFNTIFHRSAPIHSHGNPTKMSKEFYQVFRVDKTNFIPLLQKPTILSTSMVGALKIKENGESDRTDLKGFYFSCEGVKGLKDEEGFSYYKVTATRN